MPESPAIFPPPKSVESGQGRFDLGASSILPDIPVEIDTAMGNQEYRLSIRQSGITISSGSEEGAFHAGQTLNQRAPCLCLLRR